MSISRTREAWKRFFMAQKHPESYMDNGVYL